MYLTKEQSGCYICDQTIMDYENLPPESSLKKVFFFCLVFFLGAHFPDSLSIGHLVFLIGFFFFQKGGVLRTVFPPGNSEKDNFILNVSPSVHGKAHFW